jgi:iron-sulfur cluster repair protein YtfE (RIC family)
MPQALFAKWQAEHRQLDEFTEELRTWTYEVAQLGIPHFGEAANKLTLLRVRLQKHFQQEDEIGNQLANQQSVPSVEIEATRRKATQDHISLSTRLDDLIDRLAQTEPPFDSWEQAVQEVDLFIDALEQHEEQESASITWLSPPSKSK